MCDSPGTGVLNDMAETADFTNSPAAAICSSCRHHFWDATGSRDLRRPRSVRSPLRYGPLCGRTSSLAARSCTSVARIGNSPTRPESSTPGFRRGGSRGRLSRERGPLPVPTVPRSAGAGRHRAPLLRRGFDMTEGWRDPGQASPTSAVSELVASCFGRRDVEVRAKVDVSLRVRISFVESPNSGHGLTAGVDGHPLPCACATSATKMPCETCSLAGPRSGPDSCARAGRLQGALQIPS